MSSHKIINSEIGKICSKNLKSISQDSVLAEAEDAMNNYNIRHLPVVNEQNELVGMLAKSDFIALKYLDSRLHRFKVKDFASRPVKAVHLGEELSKVIELFINHKVSSVIVVDQQEAIGILTSEDLLKLLLKEVCEEKRASFGPLDLRALADEGWISATTSQALD